MLRRAEHFRYGDATICQILTGSQRAFPCRKTDFYKDFRLHRSYNSMIAKLTCNY